MTNSASGVVSSSCNSASGSTSPAPIRRSAVERCRSADEIEYPPAASEEGNPEPQTSASPQRRRPSSDDRLRASRSGPRSASSARGTMVTAIAGTISHSFTGSAGSRRLRGLPMMSAAPVRVTIDERPPDPWQIAVRPRGDALRLRYPPHTQRDHDRRGHHQSGRQDVEGLQQRKQPAVIRRIITPSGRPFSHWARSAIPMLPVAASARSALGRRRAIIGLGSRPVDLHR